MTQKSTPGLSDQELIALSKASNHPHQMIPIPEGSTSPAARRFGRTLIRRGLAIEVEAPTPHMATWEPRSDGAPGLMLVATDKALALLGIEPPPENPDDICPARDKGEDPLMPDAPEPAPADDAHGALPPHKTKRARILAMLERAEGASVAEIASAMRWQPHTTRAFLAGLRQKGLKLERTRRENGGATANYHLADCRVAPADIDPKAPCPSAASSPKA